MIISRHGLCAQACVYERVYGRLTNYVVEDEMDEDAQPVLPTECNHPDFAWCIVCERSAWIYRVVPVSKQ